MPPETDRPSALDPASSGAERIADLWWFMLGVGSVVWIVVMVGVLLAVRRRSNPRGGDGGARNAIIVGGVILPAIIITVTFVLTARPDGPLFAMSGRSEFRIEVIGNQFWWAVRYPDQGFVTANEIHIPVDTPVRIELRSADVIHSFWVPELNGKLDAMPRRVNAMTLEANRAGIYRGECAEFCGVQHARMQLLVIARPRDEFEDWAARMARPAAEPVTERAARGRDAFMAVGCASCHTIAGTEARGALGPDLTHIGSRLTLGAATIPNTRGHLGGWVVNAQSVKPGNPMPPQKIPAEDVPALLDYLETLD